MNYKCLLFIVVFIHHGVNIHSSDRRPVGLVGGDANDVIVGARDFLDVTNLRKLSRILRAALRVMTSVVDVRSSVRGDLRSDSDVGRELLAVGDSRDDVRG